METMKRNLGPVIGLYPTPVTVVGTESGGRANWMVIAHIGLIGRDSIMLSVRKTHYSNEAIMENKAASVNLIRSDMIKAADYAGMVSGKDEDKSDIFEYYHGTLKGAPLINNSPLSMECEVIDIYDTDTHSNYVLRVVNTYADEDVLDEAGNIDYEKVAPVLFEMPQGTYMSSGRSIGKCWDEGKGYEIKNR
ncbi:flavin reductase family protein [Peptoclostridium sp.]|uniref:flavin reductase family protein n=1 Tax=Peptoclostridium sp. TaxID=1904860 RepID=UPI0025FBEB29|nr:flavin reductase family protein [Peptoclostridium sp.]